MSLELSHDIIAKKVWERLPERDKRFLQIRKIIELRQAEAQAESGTTSYLTAEELNDWTPFLKQILGDPNEHQVVKDFIEKSKLEVKAYQEKEQQEAEEKRKTKEEAKRQKELAKRRRRYTIGASTLAILAVGLAVWALQLKSQADQATQEAQEAQQSAENVRDSLQQTLTDLKKAETQNQVLQRALNIARLGENLEKDSLFYSNSPSDFRDASGIIFRALDSLKLNYGYEDILIPDRTQYRSTRNMAKWYDEQGVFFRIYDPVQYQEVIQPGAILYFAKKGFDGTYENPDLFEFNGIYHSGIVTQRRVDDAGNFEGYELFNAVPNKTAKRTAYHDLEPSTPEYPPLGNGSDPLVAISFPIKNDADKFIAQSLLASFTSKDGLNKDKVRDLAIIIDQMEKQKLVYDPNQPDTLLSATGIIIQALDKSEYFYGIPEYSEALSPRDMAEWYLGYDQFIPIANAKASGYRIVPGSILFFGKSNLRYSDINPMNVMDRIENVGLVTSIKTNSEGKVIGYELFHNHRPSREAKRSSHHTIDPSSDPDLPSNYTPFGNWTQQWIAVASPHDG